MKISGVIFALIFFLILIRFEIVMFLTSMTLLIIFLAVSLAYYYLTEFVLIAIHEEFFSDTKEKPSDEYWKRVKARFNNSMNGHSDGGTGNLPWYIYIPILLVAVYFYAFYFKLHMNYADVILDYVRNF